jgi:putative FmdB family regulatory protein
MPLYEYQCDLCAHRFEVIQKFSDAPIEVCPKCGGPVGKLLSSPAIQFKGSGCYITDYARAGKPADGSSPAPEKTDAAPSSGEGGAAKTEAKSESKSESKSEAKTESKSERKTDNKPSAPSTSS